ncbi:hypothetical protein KDL01_22775 [Actinospica durhamensis]|uniref:Uncharacterized protein n=1 Tax=Actinospica durhamensis TaxID=1508375 RepID=A0A941EY50_9ACTN|nr:hypothetical protein [Actinospica durhamensis]MBR7836119.1 hypothetical protein [Actinospica durhamensis]
MRTSRATSRSWIALLAGALALTACSSSTSGGGGGGSGLPGLGLGGGPPTTVAGLLDALTRTSWDGAYVEFGDVAKVAALNGGISEKGPVAAYVGIGEGGFADEVDPSGSTIGFAPLGVSAAFTVGNLPHQVTVVYGSFDAASIGAKLGKEGFKQRGTPDGGTLWGYGTDGQTSMNNPTGVPNLSEFLVSSSRIALGDASDDVEAVAGPVRAPLSSVAGLKAVAQCLGPALAAVITPRTLSANPSPDTPMLGIGLLADTASDASEEVCVTASSASSASAIAAKWTSAVTTGRSTRLAEPFSELLTDPQATILGALDGVMTVRLTAKPAAGSRVGTVLTTFYSASVDLDALIGPS